MRSRASQFFLAVHTLLHLSHAQPEGSGQCAIDPHATVSDACTTYSALEKLNHDISDSLHDLTQNTDFFAYYRLNLYNKECPFWNDASSTCGNRACAVDTIEDEEIPTIWRTEELSKLEGARAKHPGPALQKQRPKKRPLAHELGDNVDESCVLEVDDECDERDYCVPEDEGAAAKGDYVSLVNNTERFTGYSGESAHMVWNAIYKENCFSSLGEIPGAPNDPGIASAAHELRSVFQDHEKNSVGNGVVQYALDDDKCLEQRAFYRIISGMHVSISTHLCWDYFNQRTGEWVRNVTCYKERLHNHPERVSNIYFNYALVTRAIAKIRKHLETYTFCSGDPDQDYETKQKILRLADSISRPGLTFDESVMFQDPGELELKDDFKQRFRNVSRLMDCVGCDKCRLWGKVQTAGYGAALKILFEFDENKNGENPHLRRTELVALVNTYGRLSHSLESVRKFRHTVNTGDYSILLSDGGKVAGAEGQSDSKSTPAIQQQSQSQPQPPSTDDFDSDFDFSDLDDDPYARPPVTYPDVSAWQSIKSEFDLVWRAYKMVLQSWLNMPFKFSAICIMELNRLYHYWMGLVPPPRSWQVHYPGRNEL